MKKKKKQEKHKDYQTRYVELTCIDGKSPWDALEQMSTGTNIGDVFFELDNIAQNDILRSLQEWAERDPHDPAPAKTYDAKVKETRIK